MKKLFQISLFVLALAFCACDDDNEIVVESVFEGTDNFLTAFTLTTTSGVKYAAAITDEYIVMTVPDGTSLQNATVSYEVSEQATLYPSPDEITDWDSEQVFRVIAYNEDVRDYTYTVEYSTVSSEGSVILLTQAEVDAYGETGVTNIEGNLILGSSDDTDDPITDLSALSSITEVRYNIVLNNSVAVSSLTGLNNVQTAGGLVIGTSNTSVELAEGIAVTMGSLESLGELQVNSSEVTALLFPSLETVGSMYVNANILALTDFSSLTQCEGELLFTSSSTNSYLSSLEFPLLERVRGPFSVTGYSKITTFDVSSLERIDGDFKITSFNVTNFSMPELTTANSITVTGTSSNTTETFELPSLETVTEDISINLSANYNVVDMDLSSLTTVGGKLDLRYLRALENLDISSLTSVGTQIYLYYLTSLPTLDVSLIEDLPSLSVISCYVLEEISTASSIGSVTINAGSNSVIMPKFTNTVVVTGDFTCSNYKTSAETDITISNVTSIEGKFSFTGSGTTASINLTLEDVAYLGAVTFSGGTYYKTISMPDLEEIDGDFSLTSAYYMEEGALSIPKLTRIGGSMTLNGATSTSLAKNATRRTTLDEFVTVTEIGSVTIRYWYCLADFSGLRNAIESLSESTWTVSNNTLYNPTYQDMLDGKYTADD